MSEFEPFDDEFTFDKDVLTEGFPDYILTSVHAWVRKTLDDNNLLGWYAGKQFIDSEKFILPLNQSLRHTFGTSFTDFWKSMVTDIPTFRNVLSYILQKVANQYEGRSLENILSQTSSAYAVEIKTKKISSQITQSKMKLVFRVAPIVKKQAEDAIDTQSLLVEAWESHYGMIPDDEKTVTRATDALAGLLRDTYFPGEKRPQLGTLIDKIKKKPEEYHLPASTIYEHGSLLSLMRDFSKIRGNHKTGTGRAPTHEEAGFVLHFTIMLFQLLK